MNKMKTNTFIQAALEELKQEANVDSQAASGTDNADVPADTTASGGVSETNINSDTDAVAVLMEKNVELSNGNAELQEENFDNDTQSIADSSETASSDLDDAVEATVALEELVNIANMTMRAGNANSSTAASLYCALEANLRAARMNSSGPALEALELEGPGSQVEAIGAEASNRVKEIIKRLVGGIKRVIGWVLGVIRQMMARSEKLSKRAKELLTQLKNPQAIDRTRSIDSGPFITSLRLVEGGGDANKQFRTYSDLANKTLYGFFNDSFVNHLETTFTKNINGNISTDGNSKEVTEIARTLLGTVFTEHGTGNDAGAPSSVKESDLTVGLTPPCIGGSQLFFGATLEKNIHDTVYYRIGPSKNQPKFASPATIPVVDVDLAKDMLNVITKWMDEQGKLENRLKKLAKLANYADKIPTASVLFIHRYLAILTSISTSCIPQFIRLNLQNSANFIAYVEKSMVVSKGADKAEKK